MARLWVAFCKVLRRGEPGKRLVRAVRVVGGLPGANGRPDRRQVQVFFVALPELLGMRSLSPLDMAVELGRARRQHEEVQPFPLAGFLEDVHELGAAVHLDGVHREGEARLHGPQEVRGVPGRCRAELYSRWWPG